MEKYIYDQSNGLWYELRGDYYIPCLMLNEPDTAPIGMWGRKHQQYLKEHRPMLYSDLVLSGGLHSYLADIDTQARNKLHLLVNIKVLAFRPLFVHELKDRVFRIGVLKDHTANGKQHPSKMWGASL